MNVCVNVNDINTRNIYLYEHTKNKVLDNSIFIRTGYSNVLFTLNGIYLYTTFKIIGVNKYFRKHKYILDYCCNIELINKLTDIEIMILNTINRPELNKILNLKEQLVNSNIIVFDDSLEDNDDSQFKNKELILKISGIWITNNNCGITFKFFPILSSIC